jgi:hypothetical protein
MTAFTDRCDSRQMTFARRRPAAAGLACYRCRRATPNTRLIKLVRATFVAGCCPLPCANGRRQGPVCQRDALRVSELGIRNFRGALSHRLAGAASLTWDGRASARQSSIGRKHRQPVTRGFTLLQGTEDQIDTLVRAKCSVALCRYSGNEILAMLGTRRGQRFARARSVVGCHRFLDQAHTAKATWSVSESDLSQGP